MNNYFSTFPVERVAPLKRSRIIEIKRFYNNDPSFHSIVTNLIGEISNHLSIQSESLEEDEEEEEEEPEPLESPHTERTEFNESVNYHDKNEREVGDEEKKNLEIFLEKYRYFNLEVDVSISNSNLLLMLQPSSYGNSLQESVWRNWISKVMLDLVLYGICAVTINNVDGILQPIVIDLENISVSCVFPTEFHCEPKEFRYEVSNNIFGQNISNSQTYRYNDGDDSSKLFNGSVLNNLSDKLQTDINSQILTLIFPNHSPDRNGEINSLASCCLREYMAYHEMKETFRDSLRLTLFPLHVVQKINNKAEESDALIHPAAAISSEDKHDFDVRGGGGIFEQMEYYTTSQSVQSRKSELEKELMFESGGVNNSHNMPKIRGCPVMKIPEGYEYKNGASQSMPINIQVLDFYKRTYEEKLQQVFGTLFVTTGTSTRTVEGGKMQNVMIENNVNYLKSMASSFCTLAKNLMIFIARGEWSERRIKIERENRVMEILNRKKKEESQEEGSARPLLFYPSTSELSTGITDDEIFQFTFFAGKEAKLRFTKEESVKISLSRPPSVETIMEMRSRNILSEDGSILNLSSIFQIPKSNFTRGEALTDNEFKKQELELKKQHMEMEKERMKLEKQKLQVAKEDNSEKIKLEREKIKTTIQVSKNKNGASQPKQKKQKK